MHRPLIMDGQVQGGLACGIGNVHLESMKYDDGQEQRRRR